MFNHFSKEKGYVFGALLIIGAFVSLLFVYIGFVFPKFQQNTFNSGATATPKVENNDIPYTNLACDSLGIKDMWCKVTHYVGTARFQAYSFVYPKNYTPVEVGDDLYNMSVQDENAHERFTVTVMPIPESQKKNVNVDNLDQSLNLKEKVLNKKIVVLEHAADSGKRALEITTDVYKYYLFDVTDQPANITTQNQLVYNTSTVKEFVTSDMICGYY